MNSTTHALQELDKALLLELSKRNNSSNRHAVQNRTIADMIRTDYTVSQLESIELLLQKEGTFSIAIVDNLSVSVDGKVRSVSVVNATDVSNSHHGEMSSMIYLRDQIQVAGAYMKLFLLDPNRYPTHGKKAHRLIMSALHLLSTPAQLARFDTVIATGADTNQEDWPHISLFINDLNALKPNGWRNKQDTFQMLAFLAFDAIEQQFLNVDDLLPSHKTFLAKIVPLLHAVDFPHYESSGSWEEIAARRTSVTAIETALLYKIRLASDNLTFLYESSNRAAFQQSVDDMIQKGLRMIGAQLPNESPDYDKQSIKYREADAALAYVLYYDLPPLLARYNIPVTDKRIVMTEKQIEELLLEQLETLIDPLTGGIARYKDDSYQRINFHTNEVQQTIRAIKRQVVEEASSQPIDIDKKQQLRNKLTPKGRVAFWTHPLGQIASWAAWKSIQSQHITDKDHYIAICTKFINRQLATITGGNTWHTRLTDNGTYAVAPVPAFKLPECYITYKINTKDIIVASPHTPLHWSNAMAEEATALLRLSIRGIQ